ncbi:hypothetical protein [Avibacterium paragallinarum]|uniref:hypothetical protein n=1 Tax=Avibacterium paragallinarum TaxID=728 RepID=UPI00397D0E8F
MGFKTKEFDNWIGKNGDILISKNSKDKWIAAGGWREEEDEFTLYSALTNRKAWLNFYRQTRVTK